MENLSQIETVNNQLKTAPVKAIRALHRFIYEEEGDRKNRKRLREFGGFRFDAGSPEYTSKLKYVERNLSIGDLIATCGILGLDYSESKEEIIKRICNGLMDLQLLTTDCESEDESDMEDEDDENSNNEDNETESGTNRRNIPNSQENEVPFGVHYKDIEGSIRSFNGSDAYPVDKWINDFEEAAVLFRWNDLQKLIFAKKLLAGLAKLFIQSENNITSWKYLKSKLKQEFGKKITSTDLHRMMDARKKKKNESMQEYFLVMKELASRGSIETEALIQYVIDGVPDNTSDKLLLYGSDDLKSFKKRIERYENKKKRSIEESQTNQTKEGKKKTATGKAALKEKIQVRCYNCGEQGHKSNECKSKSLGIKCFRCNQHGHKAADCKESVSGDARPSTSVNEVSVIPDHEMTKDIAINDIKMRALVDTGSQVTLLRQCEYEKVGSPKLDKSNVTLSGLGGKIIKPVGCFEANLSIDNDEFNCTMHVIPNSATPTSVIMGRDVLR